MAKNLPVNTGDTDLIPGLGRSPGGGNSNPHQYSCLENPMDRGVWQITVHGVRDLVTKQQSMNSQVKGPRDLQSWPFSSLPTPYKGDNNNIHTVIWGCVSWVPWFACPHISMCPGHNPHKFFQQFQSSNS